MNNSISNMETESPPIHSAAECDTETTVLTSASEQIQILNDSCDDADNTIHAFNSSNVNETVIEKIIADADTTCVVRNQKHPPGELHVQCDNNLDLVKCEGSDSGVEVVENQENFVYQRTLSSNSGNSHDFDTIACPRSCDSSIISCCSNYDEAYNLLVRKNSTLFEDYTRNGDVTSENGSESSSISGTTSRNIKRNTLNSTKKKVSVAETKTKSTTFKERSRTKPPQTPKNSTTPVRLKSIDRLQGRSSTGISKSNSTRTKVTPTSLDFNCTKKDTKRPSSARTPSVTRTPQVTPTDDGRWPSINSRPAPLMSRSLKGSLDQTKPKVITQMETKTIEKYATLPRRKKEKSTESMNDAPRKTNSRENSVNRLAVAKKISSRETTPSKYSSIYTNKVKQKVKIYHETSIQTALTMSDVEKALSGEPVCPKDPKEKEKAHKDIQVDMSLIEMQKLQENLRLVTEKYETLRSDLKVQTEKLNETEAQLKEERLEKEGLKQELQNNTQRVLALLGNDNNLETDNSSDSLLVLENRFQNVSHVVIRQEEEISKLNSYCRALQIDLDKSRAAQRTLMQHQQELEAESIELQDFMQAEKATLADALKEAEMEIKKYKLIVSQKDKETQDKQDECKHLVRLSEQRKQEILGLQARLTNLETKSRELLVQQGSSVSGAAVAISALIGRLEGLVDELVAAYSISDQELEDVIFHNEAYNNSSSSPESTPEKSKKLITDKTPSPKNGSSFVSAVINAIKNATAQTPFSSYREYSKDNLCTEHSSSNEMLDSETEPCLMMEHVLEDVVMPDSHSHNMISSGHSMLTSRLTQSESLKDLSQAILNRQLSEQASLSYGGSLNTSFTSDMASLSDIFPSISLVDQVIDVDNVITRLLKVIRIIQLETDDSMNELQEHRDGLAEQVEKQKETNKVVVKQLKDWEVLGSRLKSEVKELMAQLCKKNAEMDNIKSELNHQREQVEKLSQDVCELSTALSKAELETRIKEEEVAEEIKKWEKTREMPTPEVLGRLIVAQSQIPALKEKLADKEKRLNDVRKEFFESRQVLTESLKNAVREVKKQYDAIDKALEVLNKNQAVIQQYPPLAQLQRELEDTSFQTASAMPIVAPPDCNANAALLQAVGNLEIAAPINTTA